MSQCSPILHTQGVMNVPFKMVLKVKQRPTLCHSMDYTVHEILQGQNTGVGSSFLLQGIFPTQGQNPGLLHCRQFLYQLSHQGSPNSFKIKAKLKVIAESFLLSFSPDPVKKKNHRNYRIRTGNHSPAFSPYLPQSPVVPGVSGGPSRRPCEAWWYYTWLGSLEIQWGKLRRSFQCLTINVLTYFPFRWTPRNIINYTLMFICFKYSIFFNRQMWSFESRKK